VGLLTGLISISSIVSAQSAPVCPTDAAIDFELYVNDQDADAPPGPEIPIGAPLTWAYSVTNSGLVPLRGIIVADDLFSTVCKLPALAPGATALCEKSGSAGEGLHANRAKAGGFCVAADGRRYSFKDIDLPITLVVSETWCWCPPASFRWAAIRRTMGTTSVSRMSCRCTRYTWMPIALTGRR
jgi:hypothetical protein